MVGRCTPARRAVGNYFDWHLVDGRLQLQVADVVGAGASAPTIAACVRILLRVISQDSDHQRATDRAAAGIRALLGNAGAFVTAFAATLDPATGTLTYVLAGHGMAVVLGVDGSHRRLASSGPSLGLSSAYGTGWQVRTTTVVPGQTLLVLSDGFLELDSDPEAQELVDQALEQVAARYRGGIDAHQAVELVTAWAVTQDHPIDITVLALHRTLV
ncbi:PP2C family protein-serine/threonine phosphatase [Kocuria sp. SM24M-10]|uniref:PP2C family protein-serine/threonine phosphatase n=1 Tax=Kocuria sp. SM24M-10 TaxID=1660349 RepID=UPI00069B5E27|nr:SpoIIE family protein phosphatase [Kocuria sp. SM24M-10]